ncbi:MAG TPA: hypothetical protein VLV32_08935 [Burkholderiales bacterium]|nr:hypothetical protein [Burkholderiales bacterium]
MQLAKPDPPPCSAEVGAIWNPNAAANWSILFTPAFGSYLQALNWQTLGEPEKAIASKGWFSVSLVLLAGIVFVEPFVAVADLHIANSMMNFYYLYLFIWYFAVGRSQVKYVKQRFGADYARRPWGKPLLISAAAMLGCAVLFGLIFYVARDAALPMHAERNGTEKMVAIG